MVITTHYIEEARRADLVGLMRGGRLLEEDNPQSILEKLGQPTLERAFLTLCKANSANLYTKKQCTTQHYVLLLANLARRTQLGYSVAFFQTPFHAIPSCSQGHEAAGCSMDETIRSGRLVSII